MGTCNGIRDFNRALDLQSRLSGPAKARTARGGALVARGAEQVLEILLGLQAQLSIDFFAALK